MIVVLGVLALVALPVSLLISGALSERRRVERLRAIDPELAERVYGKPNE